MSNLHYRHVDVFADTPFSGNGLTVFILETELPTRTLQTITQEMRQFESIFLLPTAAPDEFRARVFTMEEELDFAGHPTLGAACVLHERLTSAERASWRIAFDRKRIAVETTRAGANFTAAMEQGKPEFVGPVEGAARGDLVRALNLAEDDIAPGLPLEVVSTGLPYLIVPLRRNLANARIAVPHFEKMLERCGAKFVFVFELSRMEGRTWDNLGLVEDIATGSAAGPMGAYLVRHGIRPPETELLLHQGSFLNRPSRLLVRIGGTRENIASVRVSGTVCPVASGTLDAGILSALE